MPKDAVTMFAASDPASALAGDEDDEAEEHPAARATDERAARARDAKRMAGQSLLWGILPFRCCRTMEAGLLEPLTPGPGR
jgi:hypothetical protein